MLTELRASELGVIADITLVLGPGMTAITGETGAGKTLVVEAVDLLVGGRADPGVVRTGAVEATVEGRFEAPPSPPVPDVDSIEGGAGHDTEMVLRRTVAAAGRSRAHVDGRMVTAAELALLGSVLVDLHGQHTHQSLLVPAAQRTALDAFGVVDTSGLEAARAALAAVEAARRELGGDARARAREIDLLRHQVGELDAAGLSDPAEDARLSDEEDLLAGATAHREAAAAAHHALMADGGPAEIVGTVIALLGGRPPLSLAEQRLRGLAVELADAAVDLRDLADQLEDNPERLAAVGARRQLLAGLRRRYGDTLEEVMAFHAGAAERLEALERAEERAAGLDEERAVASAAVAAAASTVRGQRRVAAGPLAGAVEENLRRLAMPGARVEVSVDSDDGSDVRFLLSANPGEPVAPLAKVASGGELARAMLALRLALRMGDARTLVFDEVDAGIGGEAALAVGRALADLARDHQVLVVTHLAQVAAFADAQIVVVKGELGGRTVSFAKPVVGEDRVRELARMIAGAPEVASAQAAAADLLARAEQMRNVSGPAVRKGRTRRGAA